MQNEVKHQEWQEVITAVGVVAIRHNELGGCHIRSRHPHPLQAIAGVLAWLGWGWREVSGVKNPPFELADFKNEITAPSLALQQATQAGLLGKEAEGMMVIAEALGVQLDDPGVAYMKQKQRDAWARLNSRHDRMQWALQLIAAGKAASLGVLPAEEPGNEAEAASLLAQHVLKLNREKGK